MEDYVRAHTAGSVLRDAIRIYRKHFLVLFGASVVPFIPTVVVELIRWHNEPSVLMFFVGMLLSFLNFVPVTVLVSDICVGNPVSLGRAYRRAFGRLTGRVLLVALMVLGLMFLGLILLVVPGLIFSTWYLFAGVVVVLERTSPRRSLTRSRELGKGFYLRNLGIFALVSVVVMTPVQLVSGILGGVGAAMKIAMGPINAIATIIGALAGPPMSIAVVLLYYDMRARKEAYDSMTLAEDLRR